MMRKKKIGTVHTLAISPRLSRRHKPAKIKDLVIRTRICNDSSVVACPFDEYAWVPDYVFCGFVVLQVCCFEEPPEGGFSYWVGGGEVGDDVGAEHGLVWLVLLYSYYGIGVSWWIILETYM